MKRTIAASCLETTRSRPAGLLGYQEAEGHFPAGASGGTLLPPETRLSWIAALLPYFGHRDWHRQLEFGYSWNSPQNRPVSRAAAAGSDQPGARAGADRGRVSR